MKVLKATLAFVLGLVLGIILLVVAIGGTLVALGTVTTVGKLQSSVTNETIIQPDSDLYNESVLKAVKQVLEDYQHFNTLSLKLLYEHYGINLLKGISGLDFTQKSFYDKPLTDIVGDLSILLDDIYLSDIEKLADLDFSQYNIPILNENMNVGLTKAIDNIMDLVNGDLSIRVIQNKLGFEFGVENNSILSALQDVNLKDIGGLIDALRIGTLLTADTDAYLPIGEAQVYVGLEGTDEEWEVVPEADRTNPDYVPDAGVETYIAGGIGDKLVEKELRYYQKEDGTRVADNSCYNEGWTCPEGVTLVRHRLYKPFDGSGVAGGKYFVQCYANHVDSFDNATGKYELLVKEFMSLDDIYVSETGASVDKTSIVGGKLDLSGDIWYFQPSEEEGQEGIYVKSEDYSILDKEITGSSMLRVPDEAPVDENGDPVLDADGAPQGPKHPYIEGRAKYRRAYMGTSSPLLQYLNYLSIGYVRNDTDDILKSVRIGDIIDTDDPNTAEILKALKDSTLDSIGSDINTIPFGKMFKNDENNKLLTAISDFTLENIDRKINDLKLGEIVDTDGNRLLDALKDSTLDSIPEDINKLTIGQIIDLTEDGTPKLLIALDKRGCTLQNIGTKIDTLTVGELLEVSFDEYALADDGDYVRVDVYADYNEYVDFQEIYGADAVRGDYDAESGVFTENSEGASVKTYYYALYDPNKDVDVPRYKLVTESETALAVQSLARRGVEALKMGDHLNNLSIGELMRIEKDSAQLFKTLAHRGCTLENIATEANHLTIGDIIEINEDSSQIMKSLAARGCTLENMDTIADELTLEEMVEIVPNVYAPNSDGRYVHVTAAGYVPFDEKNPDHAWRTRYTADADAPDGYRQDDNGEFVHSAYYTLYNPAVHYVGNSDFEIEQDGDDVKRFDKTEDGADGKTPSSTIMQRFASSTMDSFSNAFDEVLISDVMDIAIDIYAPVPAEKITQSGSEYSVDGYDVVYRYDKANSVYRIATQQDMANAKAHPTDRDLSLYSIAAPGEGTAILRKLAFVKVSEMDGAMEAVMQDLMLSEIIDIHTFDAIADVQDYTGGPEADKAQYEGADKRYFIPWDGKSKIGDRPIVYVYESTGKYIVRDEYYYPINEDDPADVAQYLGGKPTEKQYGYAAYSSFADAEKLLSGNLYVQIDGKYVYNVALATYYFRQSKFEKVYYRTFDSGEFKETGKVYESADPTKVFVNVLGDKQQYDPTNPAHCGVQKYYHFDSTTGRQYIVPLDITWYEKKYTEGSDIRIGTQYAREVMVRQSDSYEVAKAAAEANIYEDKALYVYDPASNKYEKYSEDREDHQEANGARYYIKQVGYVAQYGEVFYESTEAEGKCRTELTFKVINEVEREHSSKILTLLGDKTINDMNGAIEGATIGDFMDVTPGTIFDDEAIRNSTLNALGTTLASELSGMTIGKLLEWSSITTGSADVRAALNDVTLTAFFAALTYSSSTGTITLDMEKLYGQTE